MEFYLTTLTPVQWKVAEIFDSLFSLPAIAVNWDVWSFHHASAAKESIEPGKGIHMQILGLPPLYPSPFWGSPPPLPASLATLNSIFCYLKPILLEFSAWVLTTRCSVAWRVPSGEKCINNMHFIQCLSLLSRANSPPVSDFGWYLQIGFFFVVGFFLTLPGVSNLWGR